MFVSVPTGLKLESKEEKPASEEDILQLLNTPDKSVFMEKESLQQDNDGYQVADLSVPKGEGYSTPVSKTMTDADAVLSTASGDALRDSIEFDPADDFTIDMADARFQSDLVEDNNFYIVQRYMDDKYGMNENIKGRDGKPVHTREKIVNSYMNKIRSFYNGESRATVNELTNLYHIINGGDVENMNDDQKQKFQHVADAYALYENMSNATFRGGSSIGERADAIKDFSINMVWDPINLPLIFTTGPGAVLGKIVTKLGAKTITKLVAQTVAAKYTNKKGLQWLATMGGQKVVKQEIAKEVERVAVSSVVDSSKRAALKTAVAWGAYDTAAAVLNDAVFQKTQTLVDTPKAISEGREPGEYDLLQGSIAGASGVLGFGLGYGLTRYSQNRSIRRGTKRGPDQTYKLQPHQLLRKDKGLRELDIDGNPIPLGPVKKVKSGSLPLILHAIDSMPHNKTKAIAAKNRLAIEKVNGPDGVESIVKRIKDWRTRSDSWTEKVMDGTAQRFDAEGNNLMKDRAGYLFKSFLMGDADAGVRGIIKELGDMGIEVPENYKQEGYKHFSDWLTTTIKLLPEPVKKEINEVWKSSVSSRFVDTDFYNTNLDEGMNLLASKASKAGSELNALKQAELALTKAAGRTPKQKVANAILEEAGLSPEEIASRSNILNQIAEKVPHPIKNTVEKISKFQSNLIRSMVAHIGTTNLNVIGYTTASGLNSVSDITRAGLYGLQAGGQYAVGAVKNRSLRKTTATKDSWSKAGLLWRLQAQKVRNFADPAGTQEATINMLAALDTKTKDSLFRFLSGGIETDNMIKGLDIDKALLEKLNVSDELMAEILGQKPKTGLYDKYINLTQIASGVKHQDMWSKTQEFMYQFDKQIRLNHKVTLTEFFEDDNLWKNVEIIGSDGRSFAEMQSKAVEDTLRAVFGKKFGSNNSPLEQVANIVEEFHKVPAVGLFIPFGQFYNNTIAHMGDYTGGSLLLKAMVDGEAISARSLYKAAKGVKTTSRRGKSGAGQDYGDLIPKMAVGWGLVGVLMKDEARNMEEDLPIFADRGKDGTIKDYTYVFPLNFYRSMARAGNYVWSGEKIPKQYVETMLRTFGTENLTRQLGQAQSAFWNGVMDIFMDDEAAGGENLKYPAGFLKSTLADLAGRSVSAGTRTLDMVNMPLALLRGKDYVEYNRNNADVINSSFLNGIRYTDQIIAAITDYAGGENFAEKKFKPLTRENGRIPINRLFGMRYLNKQTNIQKMFARIGKPDWQVGINSYLPAVNNRINEVIFNFLEVNATTAYNSPEWNKKNVSQTDLTNITNATIALAKKDTIAYLEKTDSSEVDIKTAWLYKLTNKSGIPLNEIDTYMQRIGIMNKRPEELTTAQIKLVLESYKLEKKIQGGVADAALQQ